jgi:hypothetical protein
MALTDITNYPLIKQAIASSRPLTPEEVSAIRARMDADPAMRGFKDGNGDWKSAAELLPLLNDRYGVVNPQPMVPVARASCSKHDFAVFMGTAMGKILAGATTQAGQALFGKWTNIKNTLLPFVDLQDSVPVGSKTIGDLVKNLVDDHVIDQDEADAFTKTPDPSYRATYEVDNEATQAAGHPLLIMPSDLAALLA